MKKLVTIAFILIASRAFSQIVPYAAATSYLIESPKSERRVNSVIGFYYDTQYFGFYTKRTGLRVFEVADITKGKDQDRYMTESFMNAESSVNNYGDYNVMITYGKRKTIVINFTRFGQAYVMVASSGPTVKINTPDLQNKIDSLKQSGLTSNATPGFNVQDFFSAHYSWTSTQRAKRNFGTLKLRLLIDSAGKASFVKENSGSVQWIAEDAHEVLMKKVHSVIDQMPAWIPARTRKGAYASTNVNIEVQLIPIDARN